MNEQIGLPVKMCPFCGNGDDYVDGSYSNTHVCCHYCGETIKLENWQSRPIEDALLARAEKADAEISRLESAWLVDETIQPDGSLRPSVRDTVLRAEKAENELARLTADRDLSVETNAVVKTSSDNNKQKGSKK